MLKPRNEQWITISRPSTTTCAPRFEDDHQAKSPAEKRRGPASIKYRTPNGIEWTGKGNMKREFRDYLLSQGLTPEDKDLFLTPQFMK